MTRKDFLLLSTAIRRALDNMEANPGAVRKSGQRLGIKRAALSIASALNLEHGARFDAQRFLTDCGFGGAPK